MTTAPAAGAPPSHETRLKTVYTKPMIHAPDRVKAIRERAATSVQSITDLEAKVQDPFFRGRLQQVRYWFEDIERFFLESLSKESRTPAQESAWLESAEFALQMAVRQLKPVQDAVAKYGPNVATAPR
jgi:hypothetical protein